MHCSSVEQSGQNDARRLYRWLEHGSEAHLQRILSSSHAGVARQAHAKAASACSLVGGEAEPWLSELSELSELSDHCRTTVGPLSEVTVGLAVGHCRTLSDYRTWHHPPALSDTVGHCRTLSDTVGRLSDCRTRGSGGPQIAPGEGGTFKLNGNQAPHPHAACSQRFPRGWCCSNLRPPPPPMVCVRVCHTHTHTHTPRHILFAAGRTFGELAVHRKLMCGSPGSTRHPPHNVAAPCLVPYREERGLRSPALLSLPPPRQHSLTTVPMRRGC